MKLFSAVVFCVALVAGGTMSASPAKPQAARRPNIVFILADDLGCAQVGAYGNSYYKTPNIDGLGRDGMQFTQAYSASPVCSPTRSALMTGKSPARTHVTDFIPGNTYPWARLQQPAWQRFLPLKEVTIAERLTEEGYVTGLIGKWHLAKAYLPPESVAEGPDRQGFAETFITHKPVPTADPESDAHNVGAITTRALRFLDEHRAEPFFLLVSHNAVHAPIMAPKALVAKYPAQGNGHPEDVPVMAAMMEMVDDSVGQVLAKLDALGLRENTLVIFYSDNGGLLRDAAQTPFRGGKAELHEGGVRVPLLMRWPGVIAPGRVSATMVNTMDFFPTLLELSGARADANPQLDGISLASLIKAGVAPARDTLYWHYPHYHPAGKGPSDSIRMGDWKLIEFFEGTLAGDGPGLELFNLREDVGEETNLAASQPERVAAMRARLAKWRKKVGAQLPTINPAYDEARADDFTPAAAAP
ncbi:sulfatase [Horticoccus luteus]|uniref:Sulfatase n=1 Tax=Horticoccus luteus TaxID=2862869 RepID=A0A8F9TW26_9BACT|nr:sulfatase [Horticoccus luteus]QYM79056.1 sulfatase [Horticoccus luteus]